MKFNPTTHRISMWFINWLDLADNIIYVITFTAYCPYWGMTARRAHIKYVVCVWLIKRAKIKRAKRNE